jgi:hypothetical protein
LHRGGIWSVCARSASLETVWSDRIASRAAPSAITTRPGPGSTSMAIPVAITSGPNTLTLTLTTTARTGPWCAQASTEDPVGWG